jgi:PEP-CTERM motif-containing protein
MLLNRKMLLVSLCAALALPISVSAVPIVSSTFVQQSAIDLAVSDSGQTQVIGFAYAGNKFVGSVYINNSQLYQTDLSGGNVKKFGAPIPGGNSELYVSSSLGLGGFPSRDIYASRGPTLGNRGLYHFSNDGLTQGVFTVTGATALNSEYVKGIAFDPFGNYGFNMLVSTDQGNLYKVDSSGFATLLANVGAGVVLEGIDFAPAGFGPLGGQAVVASENANTLFAVSNAGVVTNLGVNTPGAEEIGFVPLNLGLSGNPLEGFYGASYPDGGIVKFDVSQFSGMLGDAIVTNEFGSHEIYNIHWDGSQFVVNTIGNFPNQPEDGIFVTADIINPGCSRTNTCSQVPEPATVALLGLGLAGLGFSRRKRAG